MMKLVECIPNFSEGRSKEVIDALVSEVKEAKGVILLDYSSDKNHNRSVFTLLGGIEEIEDVMFKLIKKASLLIDLTKHSGHHPRMGATDVVPFVPIKNTTIEECVALSQRLAKKVSDELDIPVYLYEASATKENQRNLADIRRGEFENMVEKMKDEKWYPSYGKNHPHPTAGVIAIGARNPLIAFNVNLATSDLSIAKSIAKKIRASSGGFKYCKAIGIMLDDKNVAQVSMNLVNYQETPIYEVFEAIKSEASIYGVEILNSELIGLAPAEAFLDVAGFYLKMEGFNPKTKIIEYHLL